MALSTTPSQTLDVQYLSTLSLAGAEISAFDPVSDRMMVTSSSGLQIVSIVNPSNPILVSTIDFTGAPFNFSNDVNSVAYHDGVFAVAVAAPLHTDNGKIFLIDASGNLLNSIDVGAQPDNVVFSPDGSKILVANEGEASYAGDTPYVNPEGSISVIDISGGAASATVQTAGFGAFNDQADSLIAEGVRLFVNLPGFEGTTVAQDLEPEYIAIAPDGLSAFVTLQEANSVAILDLSGATPTVTDIVPLGLKNWNGLPADFSDKDGGANFTTNNNVYGMYMPDAIGSYTGPDGQTYYVIANEGDDRDDFISETDRLKNLDLDDALFPNEAALLADTALGRLNVPALGPVGGDLDGDGDIDQITAYGGRSFSILDSNGNMVFDSGSQIDQSIFALLPGNFDDGRSDNKGSEPEGVTISTIDGKTYAFISLERFHATMIYDISDPLNPVFTNLAAHNGDTNPEASVLIGAADSPNGENLLVVTNENSNTLSFYEIAQMGETKTAGDEGGVLMGGDLKDYLNGGAGNDSIHGRDGSDVISGGAGMDQIRGGNGNDRIDGGADKDRIDGGAGNDYLVGGDGDDNLTGGDGYDILIGGLGRDVLSGGADADIFRFEAVAESTPTERDFIRDFSSAEGDKIDLSMIDAIAGGSDDAFTIVAKLSGVAGELAISYNSKIGSAYLQGDVDGDGIADFAVSLSNVSALTQNDFIL